LTGRVTNELLEAIRQFDGGTISNAIETCDVRMRNAGFADGHSYHGRTDWWDYILTVPTPRIVVVEDVDDRPGLGAFIGHVHASILRALGCVAYATNGSVRDLPPVRHPPSLTTFPSSRHACWRRSSASSSCASRRIFHSRDFEPW
jgi:hypothetical protein